MEKMGFKEPTPIQQAVIPPILDGRDIYAGAKTGSGKTVAFLAPLCQMIMEGRIRKALILSPVRELAIQIDEEAMKVLGEDQKDFVSVPLYGGVPLDQQLRVLKIYKPCIYVATPGRMIDFMSEGCLDLGEIDVCILDEADRMCDMGFSPQVTQILDTLPNCKQYLMFSATLPKEANDIMVRYLRNPEKIQVDPPDESSSTIEHKVVLVSRRDKRDRLLDVLADGFDTSLIFTRTRKSADNIYELLKKARVDAGILHAGYSMNERERTIRDFKDGKLHHLVATDVAARGLDVQHVTLVVQYEMPENIEDFIHRSGRAGRAGRYGLNICFVEKENVFQRRQIKEFAKKINFTGGTEGAHADGPESSEPQAREDRRPRRPDRNQRQTRENQDPSRGPRKSRNRNRNSERPRQRSEAQPRKQHVATNATPAKAGSLMGRLKKAIKKIIK